MQTQQTDPIISRALISGRQSIRSGQLPNPNCYKRAKKALYDQADIGWKQVFFGCLSIRWKLRQLKYYNMNNIRRSANHWVRNIIQRLFKFPWEFWELRKAMIKDKSSAYNTRFCNMIDARIIVEYNRGTHNLIISQRRWFLQLLSSRLSDTLQTKEDWLDQVALVRIFHNKPSSYKTHHLRY